MDKETGLGVLRRYWWIIVLFTVVGVALGAIPEPQKAQDAARSYRATHTTLLSSTSGNLYSDPVALNQIQLFATTGEVPKRVAAKLGLSVGEIAVSPALDQTTGALSITASGADPNRVVLIADTVAEELAKYIIERQDSQREDRLAASLTRQDVLEGKIRTLEVEVASNPDDVVKSAQLDAVRNLYVVALQQYDTLNSDDGGFLQLNTLQSAQPIEIVDQGLQAPKSRSTRGLFSGVAAFGVGCAVAFALGRLDRRIRTRSQAETVVGLRAQVTIPVADADSLTGLTVISTRHDSLSDAYRSLRSVIEFAEGGVARSEGRGPVVVVVSPTPGDGKTSVSANVAAAFVESGRKTVAVNADFRRPALSARILGAAPPQFGHTLEETTAMPAKSLLTRSTMPGLALVDISSVKGPPGNLARITAKAIPELSRISDVIVVDTSPITATAEVLEMIPVADVVVLVMRLNQTPIAAATRTIDTLRALAPKHLLLAIVGESADKSAYYYQYSGSSPGDRRGPWWKRNR